MSQNASRLSNIQFVLLLVSIVSIISVYYFSTGKVETYNDAAVLQYTIAITAFTSITIVCIISITLIELLKVKLRQDALNQSNSSNHTTS